MLLADGKQKPLKELLAEQYFDLARTTVVGRLHQQLRVRHHEKRYGVKSSFMFRAVELEINSMCNRKCGYCPNVSDKRPPGYMEEALFDKIIGELGDIDFDGRISYHFYGEPLLDKRLPGMIRRTRERVPKSHTEIYSNGDFLTLELFRDYLKWGLDNFLITQHDNCMPPNLQRLMDNISDQEKKHIVIRFAKDRFMINRSGLITTLNVVNEPLKQACDWPLTSIVVTLAGNVVLCCNDYYETEVLGNTREQSLREIWCSPRFEAFRKALSRGDRTVSKLCEDCDYVPTERHLRRIVPG
jgi:radical SAM protein with 4Fe4S-binding SPASM domain